MTHKEIAKMHEEKRRAVNTPVIEQEELEKNYQRPKYVMVDYQNGVTDFLYTDKEVKTAIENVAFNYDNPMAVNDMGIEIYNVETGNRVKFELNTRIEVTID